jgi:hypothetical protein
MFLISTAKLASRIGPLRRMPLVKLLAAAEIVLLARDHLKRLDPYERRRILELVRRGRGRRRNLTEAERAELAELVAKANPRQFAGLVADKLSPVPLPSRLKNGPRRK